MATFETDPPASVLTGAEVVPVVQGGVHARTTTQAIADLHIPADASIGAVKLASDVLELIRDTIGATLVQGAGITLTVNDTGDAITIASTGSYTDEQAQDAAAAMIASGTHSGISFTYDDAGNKISASVSTASAVPAGGAANQVLTKIDGADYNTQWVTPTSGSMANPMTTAGDLIIGGSAGAPTRLNAGSNGFVLTVVSGVPTWAASSGAGVTDGDKGDVVVSASGVTWTIDTKAVTYAKMQDVSSTQRVIGRNTVGAGSPEEVTAPQILDWIGATQGQILYRSATGWTSLAAGTAGQVLQTGGPGANPSWLSYRSPAVQTVASAATVTPTFSNDLVTITAQAVALTLANPSGTAVSGAGLAIRIKDNGTARTIAYGTQYRAIGVTLPTTTVAGKTMYLGLIYNSTDTKWDVVSVATEA